MTLWRTTGKSLASAGAVSLATPASRAQALALSDLDDDQHEDLVISDRATGTVAVAGGRRGNRPFDSARTRLSALDPLGVVTGQVGGDWHDDIAVIDGRTQTVVRQLTPGDALVAPEPAAEHLDAGDGRLAWSRRGGDGLHRMVVRSDNQPVEIPETASDEALTPRLGRLRSGRAVAAYVACRATRCRAYAWDFHGRRAHRITTATPRTCQVRDVAVWNRWTAYVLGAIGKGQCPARHRGLWIKHRGRRAHKLRGHDTKLGDLRNGYLAWQTTQNPNTDSFVISLRLRRLGTRVTRVLYDVSIDSLRGLGPSQISGRYVYWAYASEGAGEASRARLGGRRACTQRSRTAPRCTAFWLRRSASAPRTSRLTVGGCSTRTKFDLPRRPGPPPLVARVLNVAPAPR